MSGEKRERARADGPQAGDGDLERLIQEAAARRAPALPAAGAFRKVLMLRAAWRMRWRFSTVATHLRCMTAMAVAR